MQYQKVIQNTSNNSISLSDSQTEFCYEDFSDTEIPSTPCDRQFNVQTIRSSVMPKGTVKQTDQKHKYNTNFHRNQRLFNNNNQSHQRVSELQKPVPALILPQQYEFHQHKRTDRGKKEISPVIKVNAFKNIKAKGRQIFTEQKSQTRNTSNFSNEKKYRDSKPKSIVNPWTKYQSYDYENGTMSPNNGQYGSKHSQGSQVSGGNKRSGGNRRSHLKTASKNIECEQGDFVLDMKDDNSSVTFSLRKSGKSSSRSRISSQNWDIKRSSNELLKVIKNNNQINAPHNQQSQIFALASDLSLDEKDFGPFNHEVISKQTRLSQQYNNINEKTQIMFVRDNDENEQQSFEDSEFSSLSINRSSQTKTYNSNSQKTKASSVGLEQMEKYGSEQYIRGQEELKKEIEDQQRQLKEDNDKKIKDMQDKLDREIQEKKQMQDKMLEEANLEMQRKLKEEQELLKLQFENEMKDKMQALNAQYQLENGTLKNQIQEMDGCVQDLKTNLFKHEQIRKIQQQQIIHLKGNMRVFCRVKPDEAAKDKATINFPQLKYTDSNKSEKVQHQSMEFTQPMQYQQPNVYNFDQVFLPDSTQDELFNEIKPFVQTALDGENTCIFAYGQTGSGKTYTMEGPDSNSLYNSESKKLYPVSGILPRIAVFIQNEIERYKKQFNKEMSIEVSALEIYCEHVRDLLWKNNGNIDSQKWRYVEMKSKGQQTQCIGQTWVKVNNPIEFLEQIEISSQKRIFKNNGKNPHSSRSHHVFQIRINAYNKLGQPCQSLLNIVDLAGSERRQISLYGDEPKKNTIASPKVSPKAIINKMTSEEEKESNLYQIPKLYDLETESKHINKNLTTLGRIFGILSNRTLQGKIAPPYRECKLTRLLQSSLQHEKCKTLMIVNVCPSQKNAQQTKESLDFATKALIAF